MLNPYSHLTSNSLHEYQSKDPALGLRSVPFEQPSQVQKHTGWTFGLRMLQSRCSAKVADGESECAACSLLASSTGSPGQ